MKIGALMLAGLLSLPLFGGTAPAAETSNLSLVDAASQGLREAVRSLLASGAKADAAGADGMTALIWAAHRNDVETADLLLRAGANVNAANEYGATALYAAAANADSAMTENSRPQAPMPMRACCRAKRRSWRRLAGATSIPFVYCWRAARIPTLVKLMAGKLR